MSEFTLDPHLPGGNNGEVKGLSKWGPCGFVEHGSRGGGGGRRPVSTATSTLDRFCSSMDFPACSVLVKPLVKPQSPNKMASCLLLVCSSPAAIIRILYI